MRESIHIKNFGPIRDIEIDDIKPFTVLIGESAGGKSTVMKVLVLFRWLSKWYNLSEYLRRLGMPEPKLPDVDDLLPDTGLNVFLKPESEIIYKNDAWTLHWTQGKKLDPKAPDDPVYRKLSYIAETRGFIPSALNKPQMPRGADFGFFFHEAFNEFGESNDFVRQLELPYLNVDYRVEKKGLVTEHHITGRTSAYDITIEHASSGIQNLVPLLSILKMYASELDPASVFKKTLSNKGFKLMTDAKEPAHRFDLHIEEPELGLFPDAQCELMNTLVRQCFIENKNNVSVIMATHSPYILTHVNNMIQAGVVHAQQPGSSLSVTPLTPNKVAVYQVSNGMCKPLLDAETGLIGENAIDACSGRIYSQFDQLMEMERHEET
ncbi:MAG: ATP-binding protein [Puniceicoccales bacterium]|jgi:hypothetical protein|nr:ATP-binding protein [Puniceicoccales bacterium]